MWIVKIFKMQCFYPPRVLNEHWCIYSCLQIPPRKNWFQYVRRVYTTAINFFCIVTLVYGRSKNKNIKNPWKALFYDKRRKYVDLKSIWKLTFYYRKLWREAPLMPSLNIFQYTYYPWREQCPEASHLSLKLPCKLILQLGVHQHFLYWYRKILTRKSLNFQLWFWSVQKTTFLKFPLSFDKSYFFFLDRINQTKLQQSEV